MSEKASNKIVTLPNILSLLRLCMIPLFVWFYCGRKNDIATAAVLVLSGLTDVVDGFVARHFNMISDLGKILDPVADKLTQAAMLLCLFTRFPLMLLPFAFLALKEVLTGIMGLLVIRKTGKVHGADWHGKINTALLYAVMIIHVLWGDIAPPVSAMLIFACMLMMLVSCILYGIWNIHALKEAKQNG